MTDAKFSDGAEKPLNLGALTVEDVQILSSLTQDAVFPATEVKWIKRDRSLAILLNRFRWEDHQSAQLQNRKPERVQSLLIIRNVLAVASQGFIPQDVDTIYSLLSVTFDGDADGQGTVLVTLAGDGAIRATVDGLDITLRDVTRPYLAPSGKVPSHD